MSGTFLSNQYGMPQHIGPMPDLVGPRAGTDLNRLIGNKAAAELCKKRVVFFNYLLFKDGSLDDP